MADGSRYSRTFHLLLVTIAVLCSVTGSLGFYPKFGPRPSRPSVPPYYSRQQQQQSGSDVNNNNNNFANSPQFKPQWGRNGDDGMQNSRYPDNHPGLGQQQELEEDIPHYGNPYPNRPIYTNEQGQPPHYSPAETPPNNPIHPTLPADEDELLCGIIEKHPGSVPRGNPKDLTITHIDSLKARECLMACCEMGPKKCSYIWVYKNKCMAVGCPAESPEWCEPESVENSEALKGSGYYKIHHPLEHNIKSEFEDEIATADDVSITSPPTISGEFPQDTVVNGEAPTNQSETGTNPTVSENGNEEETTMDDDDDDDDEKTKTDHIESTEDHTETELDKELDQQVPTEQPSDTVTTDTTQATPILGESPAGNLKELTIGVSGETDVFLPDNQAQIFASSWPDLADLKFHWIRVFGPKDGVLSGMNDAAVTLSELVPGVYGLKVTVEAPNGQRGEKRVNVTVHDKPRKNTPPTPVISPSTNYTVNLPQDTVIFDASQSKDDLGPENLQFLWQQVTGPMDTAVESHEALLTLNSPTPGLYKFKLTLSDSDGAKNVSYISLKVEPERDYPPVANAGSDEFIKLPNSELILNGNLSSDDKPGLQFLWKMLTDQSGVDMEGTDTPYLKLSKLSVGVYQFELTVTDSAGQSGSSKVTIDVLPEMNEPPVSNPGGPYTVRFPDTTATLDGSGSHDDYEKGMRYSWIQISGPSDITLRGNSKSHLDVSGLHIDPEQGSPTIFSFNLTIFDYANLTSTATAELEYRKDPKVLPHVSAGPNLTITLPQNTAIINGSGTWDDFGINSYVWSRSDTSPAAGIPLLDSDTKPVLILSDLVNGTYNLTLMVTNSQGVTASDAMTLRVLANPHDRYIIQLHLDTDISNFTRADLKDLGKYLSLTLDDYTIQFQGVYPAHPHTVVEFYAVRPNTNQFMNVSEAWKKLTESGQDYRILHYHVVHVEMKECQLSCSGHGKCNQKTKRCDCDAFWMENPFTAQTGRQESNCGWSIFYVVLMVLGVVMGLGIVFWLTCWCCLRQRNLARSKRRIRYAIHDHGAEGESKRMLTKERLGHQMNSLMQSESETEEEVVFETGKRQQRSTSPSIKNNNKYNSEKYGKNSSLVNTVIPK